MLREACGALLAQSKWKRDILPRLDLLEDPCAWQRVGTMVVSSAPTRSIQQEAVMAHQC